MDTSKYMALDMDATRKLAKSHPDMAEAMADEKLCHYTALVMRESLGLSREKGRGGWWDPGRREIEQLRAMLRDQVDRGDMVGTINVAAMILARDTATKSAPGRGRGRSAKMVFRNIKG